MIAEVSEAGGEDMPITAFVLVGGFGTRLRQILPNCPKPMAPVGEKPFLEILVESLAEKAVGRIVLLTCYKAEAIEEYFRLNSRWMIEFSREPAPLGTGGAVKYAEPYASDPTLLVNGDTFFDVDLDGLVAWHNAKKTAITLSLVAVENTARFGSVSLHPNGLVTGFREKDSGDGGKGLINAGFTLLSLETIKSLPAHRQFSMEREIFPVLAQKGQMTGFIQEGPFFDIGTPESYDQFLRYRRSKGEPA